VETHVEPGQRSDVSSGSPPGEPERYEYEDVRGLPVSLLPEAINMPPPDGTEISALVCDLTNNGSLPRLVPAGEPVIFGEPLGSATAEGAARVRTESTVTVVLDGEELSLWSISDPYEERTSLNAASGQQAGTATLQKWWFVLPELPSGRHEAVMTWEYDDRKEYRCGFTVG
jgi:hypothetical protein